MLENIIECVGCGASLSNEFKFCQYCQRINPLYEETKSKYDNSLNSNESINIESTLEPEIIIEEDKKGFSIIVFILLLIFCFPIALIYLVISTTKDYKDF